MIPEGYIENYEKIAEDKLNEVTVEMEELSSMLKVTTDLIQNLGTNPMIDVGCGNGWVAGAISQPRGLMYSIDIARINCLATYKWTRAICGDVQELPFKDKSFYSAICFDVYEHVPNATRLIVEIHRVLKDDGVLLFACPFEQDLAFYESDEYEKRYRYVHLRSVTRRMLHDDLSPMFNIIASTHLTAHMRSQKMPYSIIYLVMRKR